MKKSEIAFGILRIPVDILMTVLAFVSAYSLRTVTDWLPGFNLPIDLSLFPPLNEYINFSIYLGVILFALFALNGMYSLKSSSRLSREIGKVIWLSIIWMLLIIAYYFIIREFPFSRLVLLYSFFLTVVFISIGRYIINKIQRYLLRIGIGNRRVIFVGLNPITDELTKAFKTDLRFKVIDAIGADEIHNLKNIIKNKHIDEIIQTKSDLSKAHAEDILDFCREHHIQYNFVPDLVQVQRTNIDISTPSGIPLISLKPTPLEGWGRVLKRIFDIIGSIIGLVLLSPILLITAIAIKLDSKGNVLFKFLDDGSRVKRVGQYGELFNFLKFRSMKPKTHNMRYEELANQDTRKDSPMVKIKNDPRVTRVGKFIRKTSIDELPQLWNVLKGDMSLVGPRPHLPEEVEKYDKHHKFVLSLKPGITGLAQISGRSGLDFEKENQLDTYYIENWSLSNDIKIILKTFKVVFTGKEAIDA
jgi:exopolysaccharide biosynthesis polyprenyl glycosylphosphotransferase